MFQKVHLRLTLLCAGITIIILLIMSSGWLYVSEKSLRDNSFISFQNDMNTLVSNLEQQTVISGSWLKNMEGAAFPFSTTARIRLPRLCMKKPVLSLTGSRNFQAPPATIPRRTPNCFFTLLPQIRTIMPALLP